jgi:hypothetical protein
MAADKNGSGTNLRGTRDNQRMASANVGAVQRKIFFTAHPKGRGAEGMRDWGLGMRDGVPSFKRRLLLHDVFTQKNLQDLLKSPTTRTSAAEKAQRLEDLNSLVADLFSVNADSVINLVEARLPVGKSSCIALPAGHQFKSLALLGNGKGRFT